MAASVTDTRSGLVSMLLTGGVTGPLTGMVIDGLAGGMAGSRVDMLTGVCMTLDGVAPVS